MSKVIISCAITGSLHTPTMSPHLPITPAEIADQAVAAAEAGAAILHLHARDPDTGEPTASPEIFAEFVPKIAERTDAIINITTGGALGMTLDQRLAAAERFAPELASLNMGSMGFGIYPLLDRYEGQWRFPWEREFVAKSEDRVFKNTFADIKTVLERLQPLGTRFEFECYDLAHLYTLAHFRDRGLVQGPLMIQSVMGILGGIGASPESLFFMKQTADRLFGREYVWSLFGAGRAQIPLCTMGAVMGANVRVGLEDSLYLSKGQLARSNAEQVAKIRRIIEELSLEVATPDEARATLGLKGRTRA